MGWGDQLKTWCVQDGGIETVWVGLRVVLKLTSLLDTYERNEQPEA